MTPMQPFMDLHVLPQKKTKQVIGNAIISTYLIVLMNTLVALQVGHMCSTGLGDLIYTMIFIKRGPAILNDSKN